MFEKLGLFPESISFQLIQSSKIEQNIKKMKVIFNDPATILFIDRKKYISKAHGESFDKEKGLLMCLAKANGITHLQLKKLLASAHDKSQKITEENDDKRNI